MKTDYSDILDRLGPPLWWDEHGAPRYDPFDPYWCKVYARAVALLEVECQRCGRRFKVAVSIEDSDLWDWKKYRGSEDYHPTLQDANAFHYGDPPRHGFNEECLAGDTMSSIPIRVLEFWELENYEWVRKNEYEFVFEKSEDDGI